MKPSISSLFQAVEIVQDIPPLIIGERANPNGSRRFREYLLADDFDGCLQVGLEQEAMGAHVIDLCAAYAGRDEVDDLVRLVSMFSGSLKAGLMIDSTSPDCIEECLKIYPGRAIVNSINLEDGGKNLELILGAVKKYGAAVVALTIDEEGMAMTAERKLDVARRIYDIATGSFGLRPWDIFFDPLTFTVSSGDESLKDSALQTIRAIEMIHDEIPGVHTLLGVSNVSFGLDPGVRKILNSVFLDRVVNAGLTAAIVDAGKIVPLASISDPDREVCLDLIYDRQLPGGDSPLLTLIEHFLDLDEEKREERDDEEPKSYEVQLTGKIVAGDKDGLDELLTIILTRRPADEIINDLLVPAMRQVGELFGRGELLLPFVLQSAEAMKASVGFLEPYMEKKATDEEATTIILATVQGDVHDIGKNLVDIILSNNGYRVLNLGIKVPAEVIIEEAKKAKADVIGLSGLLVKSAIVMQESMPQYHAAGLGIPILLGGAALTEKFVAKSCVPAYEGSVVYCSDAFAGLAAVRQFEEGTLISTTYDSSDAVDKAKPTMREAGIDRSHPIPEPPFFGNRYVTDIDPEVLFKYLNREALFRGRWGYRRGKMGKDEYEELVKGKVVPTFEKLKSRCLGEGLLQPKVAYGYFSCFSQGETLYVESGDGRVRFDFPRQDFPPHLCISDFFRSGEEEGDVAGFFVVTIGELIVEKTRELFEADEYHDYLMLHGLGVEITDALAEYWHACMREEMGIGTGESTESLDYVTQKYQGSRYGFGYPACPDLSANETLFWLLRPEKIGLTLTENMMMVPEQSTSAIVAHHPQAKYFAV